MIESKKVLELFAQSKPEAVKDRYLFVVDNKAWYDAIMFNYYRAIVVDGDYKPEQLVYDIEQHKEALAENNAVIVTCLSKPDNEKIGTAIKDFTAYETDGWKIVRDPKLKDNTNELAAALAQYIEDHAGSEQEEIETPEEYSQTNNAAYIQAMIDKIEQSKTDAAIATGFKNFDAALGGGLYNERLYVVAAITSLGKTTFVQNICDNIAKAGTDILYFSLEMSRHELMAKSISRHTYLASIEAGNYKYAKTALDIMAGKRYEYYSNEEKEIIEIATGIYAQYANHITTFEGIGNIGVKNIVAAVKKHKFLTGRKPVVIIDYLQILGPKEIRATDKQNADFNILELKRLARDEKIPVICISSVNRANYLTPIDNEAIKESGNIEFTADTIIGLQYSILRTEEIFEKEGHIKEKREMMNNAKARQDREIDAVITKNRQGVSGKYVALKYYPAYNYFKEV